MTQSANDEEFEGFSEEQAITIHRAFLKRWFELTLAEVDKDLARLGSLDEFDQIYLRAKWNKKVELVLSTGRAMKKYETPRGQLELVAQIFGGQLGLSGHNFPADIEGRLDWYKKCLAAEYERRLKGDMTVHKVDSPIEQIFLMEWHFLRVDDRHCVTIRPQKELELDGKTYKTDFMVESADGKVKIAIEIDGHDFHERTRQQARRDRERERTIVRHGYTLFRFTGSEVFRNPRKCVEEVVALVTRHIKGAATGSTGPSKS